MKHAWRCLALALTAATAHALERAGAVDIGVVATPAGVADDRATTTILRAIAAAPAAFAVHFETAAPSSASCADAALERRRAQLDASDKAVVPVPAAAEWADCADAAGDPFERLQRVDETFFANEESLGRARMPWVRQSTLRLFRRYRENLRWQAGGVLFATTNLPGNNNDYRLGAGRNGEFEDRAIANRVWLERTFRLATERHLAAVVLFVDADPRFRLPLRAPDLRSRERDGYYEWKLALREQALAFKGRVLIVQGRASDAATQLLSGQLDRPLRDATGRTMERVERVVAMIDGRTDAPRWLRITIAPAKTDAFRVAVEQAFDDPSGELYGAGLR